MVCIGKALKPVQTLLPGLSARRHYTTNLVRLWHTTKDERELTLFSENLVWHHWRSFAAADGHSQARVRIPKEQNKRHIHNRIVYNDWGLYSFVSCLHISAHALGNNFLSSTNVIHPRHAALDEDISLWELRLLMDCDENSAVNIYQRFIAGPPPHTRLWVRCVAWACNNQDIACFEEQGRCRGGAV